MKKKYIILLVLIASLASCTDKFEDFNTDKKHPATVPASSLFTNAQIELSDQISSTNVNLNIWKLWAQYWTETTYTDEANYDIVNRTVADLTFRIYYRTILKDSDEARKIVEALTPDVDLDAAVISNQLAIIDLLQCYSYQHLVDVFGNVPYNEALDIDNITPVYDDGLTIYHDLLDRIAADITNMDETAESFGTADLYYGGDVAKWIKFAYSLQIKIATNLAEVPGETALAQSTIEGAYNKAFSSSADDCLLAYQTSSPNQNTLYEDLVASGRKDFVAANTIIDVMKGLNDPRLPLYFTKVGGDYVGGAYGESSPFALYSHIADPIQDPTFPGILMTYYEVQFYLAEAAARIYSVGGSAASYYNNAVTESFLWWGGSADDAAAYLATPSVAYDAANWKKSIGTQEWLAFYTRGFEGYTSWRRLDFPILNLAPTITAYNQIPVRFTFPINEQTLNGANREAAASAIGGDLLTTKLFWDIH